jgi:hypothetical protein
LQAFQQERAANYEAAAAGAAVVRGGGFEPNNADYDPDIPLDVVPTGSFHSWLTHPAGNNFAAATGGPGGRALSAKAIASLLIEADVGTFKFRHQKGKKRVQVHAFRLADLERAWAERRPFDASSTEKV